jgi:hypothetical protein
LSKEKILQIEEGGKLKKKKKKIHLLRSSQICKTINALISFSKHMLDLCLKDPLKKKPAIIHKEKNQTKQNPPPEIFPDLQVFGLSSKARHLAK